MRVLINPTNTNWAISMAVHVLRLVSTAELRGRAYNCQRIVSTCLSWWTRKMQGQDITWHPGGHTTSNHTQKFPGFLPIFTRAVRLNLEQKPWGFAISKTELLVLLLHRCTDLPAQPVLQLAEPVCPGGDSCTVRKDDHWQTGWT